jgi:hypothetical protein
MITPHADNLTNVAGIGTCTTTFTLPGGWSRATAGAYLSIGAAVDTVDIWVNDKRVTGVDQNDRNQVDIGGIWLRAPTRSGSRSRRRCATRWRSPRQPRRPARCPTRPRRSGRCRAAPSSTTSD